MQNNKRIFFDVIFFLIAATEISSHIFHSQILHYIFKPLLLIWLQIYFIYYALRSPQIEVHSEPNFYSYHAKNKLNLFAKFIGAGFSFAWLGDVFLLFDDKDEKYFLFGLCAFLLTHICYTLAFLNSVKGKKSFLKKNWFYIIPFTAAGVINLIMLYPKLGTFAIPVGVYAFAIITMVLCALNRKYAVSAKSFWLVFSGAVLFLISDSILSTNKFTVEIPSAEVFVMITYIAAQYLIMKGSLEQIMKNDSR